jgi:hypothetical protein
VVAGLNAGERGTVEAARARPVTDAGVQEDLVERPVEPVPVQSAVLPRREIPQRHGVGVADAPVGRKPEELPLGGIERI